MGMECQEYTERILDDKGYMFISSVTDRAMLMGVILKSVENTDYVKKLVDGFFSENDAQYEGIDIQETTFPILYLHLENASRDRYVDDEQEVLEALKIGNLNDARYTIGMDEKIIQNKTKKDVYSAAERQFTRDSLVEELDRIYAHNNCKKFCGHPVDYMIESDDVCSQTETVNIILEALYSARRIENRRYSIVELSRRCRLVKESINALYESAVGGTVVLKIQDMKFEDEGMLYHFIINGVSGAKIVFEEGKYEGDFSFRVEEGEEPVLGVRKTGKITNDWTCFDNFKLLYYGDGDANKPDDIDDALDTNIDEVVTDGKATVVSSAWYTINGVRVAEPKQRGIYIRQDKMSDGTTKAVKVMVR